MDDLLHRGHAVQDVEQWLNNGLFGMITKAQPHGRHRTILATKTSKSLALGTAHDLPYHHGFSGEYKFRESNTTLGHDDRPSASLDASAGWFISLEMQRLDSRSNQPMQLDSRAYE